MHIKRFKDFLLLLGFILITEKAIQAQCASGTVSISGFTSDGGSGTYSDPATGIVKIKYCFTLNQFMELNTNWVHGIFVSWDNLPEGATISEGPTGSQQTQHGTRYWVFIDSLKAKSLNLPGCGFYVDDLDNNPKNNYGDNGLGTPKATFPDLLPFCFVITFNCANTTPQAFLPKITVTGDGTTGAWSDPSCPGDVFRSLNDGPNGNGTVVICGSVLPVKLVDFYGESTKLGNQLKWNAIADDLFSHFEIETNKTNSKSFITLAQIDVINPNSNNEIQEYSFLDSDPASLSLYRLKMLEKDGSYEYSKIISIKQRNAYTSGTRFSLMPNPATEFIVLQNETDTNFGELEINMYDLFGKQISKSKFISSKQQKEFYLDISTLPHGMYFVELNAQNQSLDKFDFIKK